MKKIIFATGNANKMVEVRMILADCGYEFVSMNEAGIDIPPAAAGPPPPQKDKGSGRLRGSCRRQWSGG